MFEPLLTAPVQIQIHAGSAFLALVLGPVVIFRHRRDRMHKIIGYLWVVALIITIASSFAIFEIRLLGPFSPIHVLSVFAAYSLFRGVKAAITGDISRHRKTMRGIYFGALGVAGLFTLMPGRIMAQILFGGYQFEGFVGALMMGGVALLTVQYIGRENRN